MNKTEIKITVDGSHTLYVPHLDETYHSKHGAIQEALHVYINAGFNYFNKTNLNVLEVGFGTGLNTFLTLREGVKKNSIINYTSIEAFPLDINNINQLNYLAHLKATVTEVKLFNKMHECEWDKAVQINSSFSLRKLKLLLQNFNEEQNFDLIYFDAFGPRVQPELWEESVLALMYNALKPKGILVTYCAKGSVKRGLKKVGFILQNIPGPPGKREMTRAIKN